jgi:uncharacterized protein (TIGR00369 family)
MTDPDFASRVRASFDKQRFMSTIGATLERVALGEVDIALQFDEQITQQHGFVHAGALATVADSACGYAALTMMSADAAVMSVEFKINMLAPAEGPRLVARGKVVRSGKTITVCRADVFSGEKLVATMQGTMMAVRGRALSD